MSILKRVAIAAMASMAVGAVGFMLFIPVQERRQSTAKVGTMSVRLVYVSADPRDAHLVCNRLAENDVRARMVGDFLPYLGVGAAGRAEVWADEQDSDRAERLLIEWGLKAQVSESQPGRPQFSLAAVLLFVTLVAVLLAIAVSDSQIVHAVGNIAAIVVWFTILALTIRRKVR
jgi:hypothetical protein